jgi:hypothetical protein
MKLPDWKEVKVGAFIILMHAFLLLQPLFPQEAAHEALKGQEGETCSIETKQDMVSVRRGKVFKIFVVVASIAKKTLYEKEVDIGTPEHRNRKDLYKAQDQAYGECQKYFRARAEAKEKEAQNPKLTPNPDLLR